MLTRLVKLTINNEKASEFREIFEASKDRIRDFEGCLHLKLFADQNYPNIFFTYSIWEDNEALEKYRKSDLFKDTWKQTKVLFACRPEAWSLDSIYESKTQL